MWIGIDFGTTNSAISFSDGKDVHTFKVDARLPNLLPSLIYITKNYDEFVGMKARDVYLKDNTNRPSLFKPVNVGMIRLDVGDSSGFKQIEQDVIVMIDVLAPGRLMRSIKTGLRTIDYNGSIIFGEPYSVERLISILLKRLVKIVEPQIGEPVQRVVMGRPVKFSDDPKVDQRAEERIKEAAKLAGIKDVVFLPEPIAAAYAYHRDFTQPTNTFIFDFGGGTLDLTLATLGGAEPNIRATEGVLIGGDDFDRRLLEMLFPIFGKGATLIHTGPSGEKVNRPIPSYIWGALRDWQTVEELKHSDTMKLIEDGAAPGNSTNPDGLGRLHSLVAQNLYYALLTEVEKVKVQLSEKDSAELIFQYAPIDIKKTITRHQFEQAINQEIYDIDKAIDQVIAESGLQHADVQFIVATGGSSQIPIFQQLLRNKFPNAASATKIERNLTGVVQGLGIYGSDLDAKEDDIMPMLRSRILNAIRLAPPPVIDDDDAEEHVDFSHAIIGTDADGNMQFVPYLSGKPLPNAKPVRLVSATFASKAATILLGTSLSRFVVPKLSDLDAIMRHPGSTPFYLQLERSKAEEYLFTTRWRGDQNSKIVILVTRWGNVRSFQRRFIDKPLRDEGAWKLDRRGKADPPAALVGVTPSSQLVLISEKGNGVRVAARSVSVRGNRALKLNSPLKVVACNVDGARQIVTIDGSGRGERHVIGDLPLADKSGATGLKLVRDGDIQAVLVVDETETARAITSKGRLLTLDLSEVNKFGGRHQLAKLETEERLITAWK